ncbi:hypothetical protein VNO77_18776 [Canavalia gladiata]|uniref:non-specific serine/threonine protein kinase n=1 Tax=Canavalia gladiata TaxID=3824 RepID=A0AAN9LLF5_CANGL
MLGVTYRNLKPESVLVKENGHVVLSGFELFLRYTINPTLENLAIVYEPRYHLPQSLAKMRNSTPSWRMSRKGNRQGQATVPLDLSRIDQETKSESDYPLIFVIFGLRIHLFYAL